MISVLVVEDEAAQRSIICSILRLAPYNVIEADNTKNALQQMEHGSFAVILTDLKMQGESGLELLMQVMRLPQPPEVIVMTAFGSVDTAVKAMRLGAYDYLTKPLDHDELLLVIERATEKFLLRMSSSELKNELTDQALNGFVAKSTIMQQILALSKKVADNDATVLIQGPTGTGKERIARIIHYSGIRGSKPLQCINCAAFPETLLESELFGYEKGAFTGAQSRKTGIIEAAHSGTLFLDEVADMSLNTQAKVLRVLQEREIRRLGSITTQKVDIRIIAATNKNLQECIKNGTFREDLFYRLNVIPIIIPPLYERTEDITGMIAVFLLRRGKNKTLTADAMNALCKYRWPGNVRELEAVIERIVILSASDTITLDDLPLEIRQPMIVPQTKTFFSLPPEGIIFEEWEKMALKQALERSHGALTEASRLMGMTYRTFQYRAEKFGLI